MPSSMSEMARFCGDLCYRSEMQLLRADWRDRMRVARRRVGIVLRGAAVLWELASSSPSQPPGGLEELLSRSLDELPPLPADFETRTAPLPSKPLIGSGRQRRAISARKGGGGGGSMKGLPSWLLVERRRYRQLHALVHSDIRRLLWLLRSGETLAARDSALCETLCKGRTPESWVRLSPLHGCVHLSEWREGIVRRFNYMINMDVSHSAAHALVVWLPALFSPQVYR
ncbi:MAG: hypothetical protein SGPRY_009358, partial [Prymnesium sp.]